jgi:hypothetical protein
MDVVVWETTWGVHTGMIEPVNALTNWTKVN